MNPNYRLVVEFPLDNDNLDGDIVSGLIRRESTDSGFSFMTMMYDISFVYKTYDGAVNARRKLKNKFRSKIQCQILEEE